MGSNWSGLHRTSISNGTAERLNHEFWAFTRVLLFASKAPYILWAETMNPANWLRSRLLASHVQGYIPMLFWKPRTIIRLYKVPVFRQPRFAFRYRSDTAPNKKLNTRTVHGHFVRMQRDETLLHIYIPHTKSIIITRAQDFRPFDEQRPPGVESLLDGIARQSKQKASKIHIVLQKRFSLQPCKHLRLCFPVDSSTTKITVASSKSIYQSIFAPTLKYLERFVKRSFSPSGEKPMIANTKPFETESLRNTFLAHTMCARFLLLGSLSSSH